MAEQLKLSELFQKGMEGQRRVESGEIGSRSEEFKVWGRSHRMVAMTSRPKEIRDTLQYM